MSNPLFKPVSPLWGWYLLMEILTTLGLGAYWYEILHNGIRPWDRVGLGMVVTILFILSHWLLLRHRRWAAISFAAYWLLFMLLILPTA